MGGDLLRVSSGRDRRVIALGLLNGPKLDGGHDAHGHGHGHHGPWFEFVEWAVFATNAVGATILLLGVLLLVANLILLAGSNVTGTPVRPFSLFDSHSGGKPVSLTTIRIQLGVAITFALQLLVIADVLDTMAKPVEELEFATLLKLGLVVLVRETLAFLMGKEVEHLQHEDHGHAHDDAKKHH